MIIITGEAGFIGSNFVLQWHAHNDESMLNLDALTCAGNLANLQSLEGSEQHLFVQGEIGDAALLGHLFAEYKPLAVLHFAAESHVDRSITGPEAFVEPT
jgi:dTDP-glucose 4,6-dehydratase